MSWEGLLAEARAGSRLKASPDHGERHWRAVAATGLEIARRDDRADAAICVAFAVLHDCRRVSEYRDPQHGPAAARVARESRTLRDLLGEERAEIVATACHDHEGTTHSREWSLVGACFDADRFTLGRVGIDPDPRYFSLILDDPSFSEMVRFAQAASDAPPKWADLFAEVASA